MESSFAGRVKQFRSEKQLSQTAFGDRCGLTQGNIAHMEGGKEPLQSNVAKLIGGFPDLSPDWLLLGTGSMLRGGRALTPAPAPQPTEPAEPAEPADEAKMPATVKRKLHTPMAVVRDVESMTKDEQIDYYKNRFEVEQQLRFEENEARQHQDAVRLVSSGGGRSFTSASLDAADEDYMPPIMVAETISRTAEAPAEAEPIRIRRWGNLGR